MLKIFITWFVVLLRLLFIFVALYMFWVVIIDDGGEDEWKI